MFGAYLLELGKSIAFVVITVFLAFGGFSGIAGLATWRWKTKFEADMKADFDKKLEAFKAELQAKVQKEIETHKAELQSTADELSQTLSEKITRRSKAFDLQIKKEYEFYEKFGVYTYNALYAMRDIKNFMVHVKSGTPINEEEEQNKTKAYNNAVDSIDGLLFEYEHYLDKELIITFGLLLNNIRDFGKKATYLFKNSDDISEQEFEESIIELIKNAIKYMTDMQNKIKDKTNEACSK